MFTLDAIMSTDLVTLAPSGTLAEARELMQEYRIHHIPVVDDMTLTNVLAATDSVLRKTDNRIHASDIRIEDVMVTEVATVDRNASLRQAALFLEKHRIGCLPVIDAINLLEQLEDSEPVDDDFIATG
jgi:CBS domain-containing protein